MELTVLAWSRTSYQMYLVEKVGRRRCVCFIGFSKTTQARKTILLWKSSGSFESGQRKTLRRRRKFWCKQMRMEAVGAVVSFLFYNEGKKISQSSKYLLNNNFSLTEEYGGTSGVNKPCLLWLLPIINLFFATDLCSLDPLPEIPWSSFVTCGDTFSVPVAQPYLWNSDERYFPKVTSQAWCVHHYHLHLLILGS